MNLFRRYFWLFGLLVSISCRPDKPSPEPEIFTVSAPGNLGKTVPFPERNPFTKDGVLLGRKLFYDPILSGNNKLSCASCHNQKKAFTDGIALSAIGHNGQPLKRHAPALINIAWMDDMFWDGGAKNLESLNFGPIKSPDEMGQDLTELVTEIQNHPEYPLLFKAAFNSETITSAAISRALSQFERTLISANSRYDKYVRKEPGGTLNQEELEGLHIFKQKCGSCHATDLFTDNSYHNNGLDTSYSEDHENIAYGRGRITSKPEDIGKFKTPTLRNIALTAPYMHDGRFQTLESVLEHYRSGVKTSASLSPLLQQNKQPGLEISDTEKTKIIAFLHTLTDTEFVNNPEFAAPE